MDGLFNGFPFNQGFDFSFSIFVCYLNEFAYNAVGAGVRPVGGRILILIRFKILYKTYHTPWIVHIGISKDVTIIPFLD